MILKSEIFVVVLFFGSGSCCHGGVVLITTSVFTVFTYFIQHLVQRHNEMWNRILLSHSDYERASEKNMSFLDENTAKFVKTESGFNVFIDSVHISNSNVIFDPVKFILVSGLVFFKFDFIMDLNVGQICRNSSTDHFFDLVSSVFVTHISYPSPLFRLFDWIASMLVYACIIASVFCTCSTSKFASNRREKEEHFKLPRFQYKIPPYRKP